MGSDTHEEVPGGYTSLEPYGASWTEDTNMGITAIWTFVKVRAWMRECRENMEREECLGLNLQEYSHFMQHRRCICKGYQREQLGTGGKPGQAGPLEPKDSALRSREHVCGFNYTKVSGDLSKNGDHTGKGSRASFKGNIQMT